MRWIVGTPPIRRLPSMTATSGHRYAGSSTQLRFEAIQEPLRDLMGAVAEAPVRANEGMKVGAPTPDDELRRFMVSSLAPFHVLRFLRLGCSLPRTEPPSQHEHGF